MTSKRTGTRSARSRTWVTMPTMRASPPSVSSVLATVSSLSGSSVPKPSSRKIDVELRRAARRQRADLVGERQRQRERSLERLAAGQRLRRPALVGVAMVDDLELVVVVDTERVLTARELLERHGRAFDQRLQRFVHDPLLESVDRRRRASSRATSISSRTVRRASTSRRTP